MCPAGSYVRRRFGLVRTQPPRLNPRQPRLNLRQPRLNLRQPRLNPRQPRLNPRQHCNGQLEELRGAACVRSAGVQCPAGTAQPVPCPAGRYGAERGLDKAQCTGACAPGYICPAGGTSPTAIACEPGTYNQFAGGSTIENCVQCPRDTYTSQPFANTQCVECFRGSGTRGLGSASAEACECQSGTFRAGLACLPCPDGVLCDEPGAQLETLNVSVSRWRTDPNSTTIETCPPRSCVGGTDASTSRSQCMHGHEGPLCAVCLRGFRKLTDYTCVACEAESAEFMEFLPVLILGLVLCTTLVTAGACAAMRRDCCPRHTTRAMAKEAAPHSRRQYREPPKTAVQRIISKIVVKLKIIVANQQVLQGLGAVYRIVWPQALLDIFAALSVFDLDLMKLLPGLACVWQPDFLTLLVIRTTVPLLILALLLTLGVRARRRGREAQAYMLTNGGTILMFLLYPSITRNVFAFFQTQTFDGTYGTYLRADYSVRTTGDVYQTFTYFAVAMIFIWPLGVPLVVAVLLWRNRAPLLELRRRELVTRGVAAGDAKLQAVTVEGYMWSLTESYRPAIFYFELVEYVVQKLLLVGIAVW